MGSRLVSWFSKKQSSIALSTAEAEYVTAASCCTQLLWMMQTLQDFQISCTPPISILCDNTSAISISKNPVMHSKTKHIPIKYHFLREQLLEQKVKLEYVPSKEQVADILTKPLPRETFEYLRQKMGVVDASSCWWLYAKFIRGICVHVLGCGLVEDQIAQVQGELIMHCWHYGGRTKGYLGCWSDYCCNMSLSWSFMVFGGLCFFFTDLVHIQGEHALRGSITLCPWRQRERMSWRFWGFHQVQRGRLLAFWFWYGFMIHMLYLMATHSSEMINYSATKFTHFMKIKVSFM